MTIRHLGTVVLVALLSSPAFADFDRGLNAADQGDYATAFDEFLAAGEQGNVSAQSKVGAMYREGRGTPPELCTSRALVSVGR